MSVIVDPENPQLYVESMWRYVLDPLRTAVGTAADERAELAAEERAFEAFIRRLRPLEPITVGVDQRVPTSAIQRRTDAVRDAYRETVIDVDHYDAVYGEPLLENAAAELGADAATVLGPDSGSVFTPQAKQLLINSAELCLEERRSFDRTLEAEVESLDAALGPLTTLVESLDGTLVPAWYRETFESELADILTERQQYLHSGTGTRDTHDLCEYLYGREPWQYPVLTGVTRLQNVTAQA